MKKSSSNTATTKVLSCLVCYRNIPQLQKALEGQKRMIIPTGWDLDILVIDNSVDLVFTEPAKQLCLDIFNNKIQYLPMKQNLGVSGAYAKACDILNKNNSYTYLWLWDQDSEPQPDALLQMSTTWNNLFSLTNPHHRPVGVVVPKLVDPTGRDQHWVFFTPPYALGDMRCSRFPMDMLSSGEIETTYMVNSGAMISRKVIEKIGAPNVDFFMDLVDFEYSSRIILAGFKIIVNANTWIAHSVGEPVRFKLLGRTIWARNYPIFRYYYQAKNEILLSRLSRSPRLVLNSLLRLLVRPVKIFFDRKLFFLKLIAHFLGILDGLLNKKGLTHSPWMMKG